MNKQTYEEKRKISRRALLIASGVGALAVLGGAACAAKRVSPPQEASADGGLPVAQSGGAGPAMQRAINGPNIKNAPEVPSTPPDVRGIFKKREDNSLFIGTGIVTMAVQMPGTSGGSSAGSEVVASHDGPEVEVVVTRKTQLFKDTTLITMEAMASDTEIQQTIEPIESFDTLAESLGKSDWLSVWGARNGDRYVASLILFRPPVTLSAPV